jgi:putative pyruvate formate lyase activating enzyme
MSNRQSTVSSRQAEDANVEWRPSYLVLLETGEFLRRVEALEALLASCTVCPLDCGNNRLENELARCYSGRLPIVSSYTAHFGEEPALVGANGAGNIFFGNCNLRCVYCQNFQISQAHKTQLKNEVTHERLAEMMLELQARGCHNINFVSPTHFAPQMARAIYLAARAGLRLPIVYNTNAYDSVEVLRLLEGVVDVYLPDLKYAENDAGYEYSKVRNYAEHSRRALLEMYRQTGEALRYGADSLLKRGLVIRLLVLPNDLASVRESLQWISSALSPRVAVSMMAQYYATNRAATDEHYTLLSRRITESEYLRALALLDEFGMEEGWMQEYDGAAHYYRPDFTDRETPFKDIRDFDS